MASVLIASVQMASVLMDSAYLEANGPNPFLPPKAECRSRRFMPHGMTSAPRRVNR
jgi:hypothetical protein